MDTKGKTEMECLKGTGGVLEESRESPTNKA